MDAPVLRSYTSGDAVRVGRDAVFRAATAAAKRMNPQRMAGASGTGGLRTGRLKWHHIYYLLAAFDLATISFGLFLNHRILGIYTDSVALNREWAERAGRYADLALLSSPVNAPGNDVFDTHDVDGEEASLDRALGRFEAALAAARADLSANVPAGVGEPLAGRLDRVERSMGEMVAESRVIFQNLRAGAAEVAGRRMAEMDRTYFQVRMTLDELQRDVRAIQDRNFDGQTAAAVALGKYEYLVAAFIVVMVAAVTLYGHNLARTMQADQADRERILVDLRAAEARTRAIVDTAADAVIISDQWGVIESVNPAAERMFGYTRHELCGESVGVLMPPGGRAAHEGHVRKYLETGKAGIIGVQGREVIGQRRDGSTFPLEISISEVRSGGRHLFTAILHDITRRKRADELIRRYNEELEETVRERTEGLRVALATQSELASKNAQAYEVIRRTQEELLRRERLAAIGEVVATVAHGIRNPLASIRAAAEVQREDLGGGPMAETLDDIVAEAVRLESRIRSVLDLAQPFASSPAMDDLNEFIEEFTRAIGKRIPEGVRFGIELDPAIPRVLFDRVQLREVLEAIVVNALEAMNGRGVLTIRSALAGNGDGRRAVTLSVADTGPGIEAARIGRIFELFYTSKPSGTGIGLAIARRLVEAQGGTLEVASEVDRGAVFTVRLPLPRQAA